MLLIGSRTYLECQSMIQETFARRNEPLAINIPASYSSSSSISGLPTVPISFDGLLRRLILVSIFATVSVENSELGLVHYVGSRP